VPGSLSVLPYQRPAAPVATDHAHNHAHHRQNANQAIGRLKEPAAIHCLFWTNGWPGTPVAEGTKRSAADTLR
jgi:hypothetical protein